jgi:hypothetical protein
MLKHEWKHYSSFDSILANCRPSVVGFTYVELKSVATDSHGSLRRSVVYFNAHNEPWA